MCNIKKAMANLSLLAVMFLVCATNSSMADSSDTETNARKSSALKFISTEGNELPDDVEKVSISKFKYEPAEIRIEPGTTIVWVNNDPAGHNVAFSADNASKLDKDLAGPVVGQGERIAVKFDESGKFPYFCTPHPFMKATVIVE